MSATTRRRLAAAGLAAAGLALGWLAPARAEVGAPAPTAQPARAGGLWRLPDSASSLRLVGEADMRTYPVYVPSHAASSLKRFQIGLQAAVQVMPEASWLSFTVNGQTIGHVPIAAPTGVRLLSFDLPPGIVQAGWNAVAISVTQSHRVDCSLASTYELWTQIDPATTGFVGGPPPITALADLPALPTDEAGATPLHLLLPKQPSPTDLARAVKVTGQMALRGHLLHPVVDTVPAASGLQIAVGTTATLAALPGTAGRPFRGASLDVSREGGPLLVVAGATDEDLDRAIEDFGGAVPEPAGTEEGLAALARLGGRRLKPGSALTFDDLGIRSRTFAGRVFRQSFDVVLPPDAYPADYAEAELSLDGGYAPGLTEDARLIVRVNGMIDGTLAFGDPRGMVLQRRVIHMPLEPFHPGHNTVDIEAQLPSKADGACDTLNAIGAKERLLVLGTSTLSLPPLARVAQFPNLSASMTGNLRVTPGAAPRLYLPRTTDAAISAVATLMANASLMTGSPATAVFGRGVPQPGSSPAIVVGTSDDVPAALLASAGIDAPAMSTAWRASAAGQPSGSAQGPRDGSDSARLDAWGQRIDDDSRLGGFGSTLRSVGGKLATSMRSAGLLRDPDQPIAVTRDTSFVVAQGMADDTPLTLVTARDDRSLAAGMALLTDPAHLARLDGRAASFDDGDGGMDLVPARDTTFFRTQDFALGNDRLVAAGWVSKHAAWYIGAVLLSVLLLGSSTAVVLAFGRPRARP